MARPEPNKKLVKFGKEQELIFDELQRFYVRIKEQGELNLTIGYLEGRLSFAHNLMKNARSTHAEIESATPFEERMNYPYFEREVWANLVQTYHEIDDLIGDKLNQLHESHQSRNFEPSSPSLHSTQANVNQSNSIPISQIKYPKLDVRPFSGDYEEWTSYRDLFVATIHNNPAIPDIQKLLILNTSLKGEAFNVIKALKPSEQNYASAWKSLCDRYDNDRIIISTLLNKLLLIPDVNAENVAKLKHLRDTYKGVLDSLKNLGCPVDGWDPIIIHTLVNKFNLTLKRDWESKISELDKYPKLDVFEKFINKKIRVLEVMQINSNSDPNRSAPSEKKSVKSHNSVIPSSSPTCRYCNQSHYIYACPKFKELSTDDRHKFRVEKKLCANCLAPNHISRDCKSSYKCKKCAKPHHTLLHFERKGSSPSNFSSSLNTSRNNVQPQNQSNTQTTPLNSQANQNQNAPQTVNSHLNATLQAGSLLSTALVKIKNKGRILTVRTLIDSGSETSFISESAVQALHLNRSKVNVPVAGIGGNKISTLRAQTQFCIGPNFEGSFRAKIQAYILPKISSYKPKPFSPKSYPELQNLTLADPNPSCDLKIDLLLGADAYSKIILGEVIKLKDSQIVAQSTELGWTLIGPSNGLRINGPITIQHGAIDVEKAMQTLWEFEQVPDINVISTEDEFCENYFKETVRRDDTGRFIVRLPFKSPEARDSIGNSKPIAYASFKRLKFRLAKNEQLNLDYNQFMTEYETLGHMSEIMENEPEEKRVFFPHHAVVREESSTTKTRVVFNASCPTSNGVTLNDTLCAGPKLQNDITNIMTNWRNFRFVFTADIEKMFRQILIDEQDRKFQNILWSRPESEKVSTFELNTVSYGTKSAPYLSMRVIKEIALSYAQEFPLALEPLLQMIYVDDVLYGSDDIKRAILIRDEITTALARGGLNLRKWSSNTPELIPESEHSSESISFNSIDVPEKKVLGIMWSSISDVFTVKIEPVPLEVISKRSVLSNIAKLYDPLGWFSAITIRAKILLQLLWLQKVDWDDPIAPNLEEAWVSFCKELPLLEKIKIPRWTGVHEKSKFVELVGFCDASGKAYSAIVYLKVTDQNGDIKSTLLMAKARVAPLKTISIPRLELCGAVLLTKLIGTIKHFSLRQIDNVLCYTDSKIALDWLAKQPCSWLTFVANRVSYIQTKLPSVKWQHVRTKENPADLNSRGLNALDLIENKLWWHGPVSICGDDSPLTDGELEEVSKESRPTEILNVCPIEEIPVFYKCSSWSKLIRIIAFMLKFVRNCKIPKNSRKSGLIYELDESLITKAKILIFKYVQKQEFAKELSYVENKREICGDSPLKALCPFLDENGILRVEGRLQFSDLPFAKKHPIILPKHYVTTLLIRYTHLNLMHGALQLTLQQIRDEYWILRARNTTKTVIRQCITCVRQRAELLDQKMSPLPAARCTPARAFEHSGVDYAGPFLIKDTGGRGHKTHKAYIAVFVCFVTKAIHLEIVTSYTTEAFLAAFKRFVSRRGLPNTMYSDNGTNFRGANSDLKRAFKVALRDESVLNAFSVENLNWKFIPPMAPHYGGLWESSVKAVKFHLKRVIGSFYPTLEEMITITCQIEACLNSRPLVRLNDDPNDLQALTPGHFLMGSSPKSVPEKSYLDLNENLLKRWQLVSKIIQSFWKRWNGEYLHTLQPRTKWRNEKTPLQLGDIVIIRNPNNPPCTWPLAKVVKVIHSNDGLVRDVIVRTSKSEFERSVTQLCKLPVDNTGIFKVT